ncbi:MAG: nucleotidyltransferase substrate binding protein [Holosporaceae bacterium]|jgi:nucleotidyltransferase substrate binding protein (TIGR01987 family)|nr:nucleotidyltransferase substrate binding protein [Holosporaceae bacterium]
MNINNLKSALQTLEEGYKIYASNCEKSFSDMLADSCIKRFEYTLETAIKTMKKFLKEVYFVDEKDLTVNNMFKLMEGYEFISSWHQWRNYYQSRNNTAHEYNIRKSRELLNIIPEYIKDVTSLVQKLQEKIEPK